MTRAELPVRHADVRGATLAWTEEGPTGPAAAAAGQPPTAIWAHGLSSTRDAQEESGMFDWAPIAERHRLIRYDARGHGDSNATPEPGDYAWANLGQDLLALLDQVAPGEPVVGIGSSMGTATLLYAAALDPARFSKLVLTSPPTAWQTRAAQSAMYEQIAGLVEQQGVVAFQAMMVDAPAQPPVFAELSDEMTIGLTDESMPIVFRGAAKSDLPSPDALRSIEVPTLILAWAGDPGHPVSTAALLAEYLQDAEMRVAETPAQLREWGALASEFIAR
ncbi:hypothetical protein AX769_11255 [Frondihabitans sp. PAMC 28766]|uniref:alpha/beta fold hydrolase n=1 Tax=Frondihabitans sp. PAMC 28766 TaxID=1795630 RepID=UPI00078B1F4A|nr:alpha/beta fold hydrolase [Frondihabitans sp. PAMC 28766]AMM20609.1 hypothetical protein AX769_11255 [Frondihabitans sp. PAMC 28766]